MMPTHAGPGGRDFPGRGPRGRYGSRQTAETNDGPTY